MDENSSSNERHEKRRGGLFFPLLLLSAGVLLLMSNFGYLPGGFWGFVQMYWPALLIVAGLDGLIRGNGITVSILVAGFGGVLMAGNLGYITVTTWDLLAKAWPLIFIGMGLDIIIGHRTAVRSIIGLLFAFLLIAGLVWMADLSLPGLVTSQNFNQKYQNETSFILNIERTAGRIELEAGKSSTDLLDAKLNLIKNEKVDPVIEQKPGTVVIVLANANDTFPGSSRPAQSAAWKLAVNPNPELTLHSKVVMGETDLDLRGLNVKEITCETATGKSDVYLAETLDATYHISGATGQITLHVPAGAPVKIVADKAIGAVSFPDKYTREDGYIKSPAYQSDKPAIQVSISLPIGAIQVVEYSTSL